MDVLSTSERDKPPSARRSPDSRLDSGCSRCLLSVASAHVGLEVGIPSLAKPQVSALGDHAAVMPKTKRVHLVAEAHRRNLEQVAKLGGEVRAARLRRRLTQQHVADLAGVARSTESAIERGLGGGHTLDTWQRIAISVGRH